MGTGAVQGYVIGLVNRMSIGVDNLIDGTQSPLIQ